MIVTHPEFHAGSWCGDSSVSSFRTGAAPLASPGSRWFATWQINLGARPSWPPGRARRPRTRGQPTVHATIDRNLGCVRINAFPTLDSLVAR
jgi:hypothetical protein